MADQTLEVCVSEGKLKGLEVENVLGGTYVTFRGIPFAKPPVGELRFQDPQPPEKWSGVRDATKFGSACAHMDMLSKQLVGSDDCLFLNVSAKTLAPKQKRAVMVWIHGGSFVSGSGDDFIYGPDFLVKWDVVLVTINYRLGVLGFLNLDHAVAPGNQGLKDQVMALKWVQRNIDKFGGDPNNVTIFGESAGGASVHYLTLSPLAKGLFQKAIAQSGVATNPWATPHATNPKEYAYRLAAKYGETSNDPKRVVEFFRSMDARELVSRQMSVLTVEEQMQVVVPFIPTTDTKSPNPFMPQPPSVLSRFGVSVPFVVGYTSEEGLFFTGERLYRPRYEKVNTNMELALHPNVKEFMKREKISAKSVRELYFGDRPINKENAARYADLFGDSLFIRDIQDVARIQSEKYPETSYLYEFSYDSGCSMIKNTTGITLPGTAHSDDLGYLFYPSISKMLDLPVPDEGSTQRKVMECFQQLWTDFAKTGDPTPKKTDLVPVKWEPLKRGEPLRFLKISECPEMQCVDKSKQRHDWTNIKNKL